MNNNATLRSSLLYFVDEAIGYRHSLHFFHRWLETGQQSELEGLILEVGRERFVDFAPLLATIKNPNDQQGFTMLTQFISIHGIFTKFTDSQWPVKIKPMPTLNTKNEHVEGSYWALHHWLGENTIDGVDPFRTIATAYTLLKEASNDFMLVFDILEMMFGRDNSILSCVKNEDICLLGRQLAEYYPAQAKYINQLATSINKCKKINWYDALSRNQIKSKMWLIDKLEELKWYPKKRKVTDKATNVLLVGGWVGTLPFLAGMRGKNLDTVTNIDIDLTVHGPAQELNSVHDFDFKVTSKDVRTLNVKQYSNPIVIDTIVEHFENHGEWVKTLPPGTRVVLQGNDMFHVPDHVNCHKTLEEFVAACGLNNIIWAGELNLYKCTRYMAIGTV